MTELPATPATDNQAAIDFLRRWAPDGPWVLTAIVPDVRKTFTETFTPAQEPELRAFLEKHNGQNNCYFLVNPLRQAISKKTTKADMHAACWLHVDVDPRAGEPLESERERALRLLREFSPRPSVIIDSGGGYQGFWRLAEPHVIDGDVGKAEEFETYNQQLEILLGGDHCHNINRIMRLPGTLNIPDAKKHAKGRRQAVARLVEFNDLAYPLSAFTPAPRVQTTDSGLASGRPKVRISGNLPRLSSVDDLPDTVSPRTKMLIVQGGDPDNPAHYKSRSEALFAVCCDLVRASCDDDTIASVIMDPDFGISASVLDKPRPERYAARQIEQAKEHAEHPKLPEMNQKHAVIEDVGGRCRILSITPLPLPGGRVGERIAYQSFDDFRNRYGNEMVEIGRDQKGNAIQKPLGEWWIKHPRRRQYETVVFAPEGEIAGCYNLWAGFACTAAPGDNHQPFLDHLRDNLCNGNAAYYDFVIRWMAMCVQRPAAPGEVAIVLRGLRGTGKGFVANAFGSLFGRHFKQVSDRRHVAGNFNAHLQDCVVLFADEAFSTDSKQDSSTLKRLITEPTLTIEAKGRDVISSPNYLHIIMASNEDWVVPAGLEERRFFVLDVGDQQMQNRAYFANVSAALDCGGRENLLHYLLTLDLTGFDVTRPPMTEALLDQKRHSMSEVQSALLAIAERGYGADPDDYRRSMPDGISVRALMDMVMRELGERRQLPPPGLLADITSALRRCARQSEGKPVSRKIGPNKGKRRTMYQMPELAKLRARFKGFEEHWVGQPSDWVRPPEQGRRLGDDTDSPF